jgi:hypothetical protein
MICVPVGYYEGPECPQTLARSEGFEPPTPRFEVWCSIQLSYERVSGIRQCSDLARRNLVGRLG